MLVRVHVQNTLVDSLAGTHGRGWPLRDIMKSVDDAGEGVIVFLRQAETPRDMVILIESMLLGSGCRSSTATTSAPTASARKYSPISACAK